MSYKYATAHEWLKEASKDWDIEKLRNALLILSDKCDSDDIQDHFQQEMDEDGYFEKSS